MAWIGGVAAAYSGPGLVAGSVDSWPAAPWWLALALLALSVAMIAAAAGGTRFAAAALVLVALACGLARGTAAVHHPGPRTVDGYIGSTVQVDGTVESVSTPLAGAGGSTASQQQRLRLSAEDIRTPGGTQPVEGLILVQVHSQAEVWPGQRVRTWGRLARLRRLGPGGVAGYADRLERQGVEAELMATTLVALTPPPTISVSRVVDALRQGLVHSSRDLLPEPEATILLGEVAGIRGRLPPALDADLVDSGLVHVLAISGIKVAIVAGLLQLMTAAIAGRRAALGAIAGIGLYTVVGGASASALRSAFMGSLSLVARSLRRDSEVLRSLLLAAAVMLAWRPSLVADLSFQYSFLGVLGIHLFAEAAARQLGRVPKGIREAMAVTTAAQVATLPLTAHYFQVVPLLAPVANAIVLPTLPVSIAGGLLLGLVGALVRAVGSASALGTALVAGVEVPIASLLLWLARLTTGVGHLVAHLPGAVLRAPNFEIAPTAGYYAALAAAIAGRRWWRTPVVAAVAAGVGMVVLLWLGRPDGRLHVSFLGAGGGPAVLVVAPDGAVMLVDTGSQAGALSAALDAALPAGLPGPGRRRIDAVFLTGDSHAEAGGLAALDRFSLGTIFAPEQATGGAVLQTVSAAARRGTPVVASHPGDRLLWHQVGIDVISAATRSQALTITYGGARMALVDAAAGEPAVVPAGDYAVVGLGLGASEPVSEGVGTRLAVVQDAAGRAVARGLRQVYGDALWQSSRDGRLDLTCDRRRCWW